MRKLTSITRRTFGRGMGASLTLAGLPDVLAAHDGTHEVAVEISRFKFKPSDVEIHAGDSVIWSNRDIAPHTATAEGGGWDTGSLGKGDQARIAFDEPGEYPYICAFHPHMKGRVVVSPKTET